MKLRVWPSHGRVVYIDGGRLVRVTAAIGTVLPLFALQVLCAAAGHLGVVGAGLKGART